MEEYGDYVADMYGEDSRENEIDLEDYCRRMYLGEQPSETIQGLKIDWKLGHIDSLTIQTDDAYAKIVDNLSLPSFQFLRLLSINYVYNGLMLEQFAKFKCLSTLDIRGNALETIPSEVIQLKNLKRIDISHNELPDSQKEIKQLEKKYKPLRITFE